MSQADYQTYLQQMSGQGRYEPIPQWVIAATPAGSIAGDPNTGTTKASGTSYGSSTS